MMLDQSLIDSIRSKADIVQVISSYLDVEKKGSNYLAICPFHHDTSPSLTISPTKQIFTCFVCHTTGNAFSFVMKYEHIGFIDAVKKVCSICGIDVPELNNYKVIKRIRENEEEHKALEQLSDYYAYMLDTQDGIEAKNYLISRQLQNDVIKHFKIGYAPLNNEESVNMLRNKLNIPLEVLDRAGITSSSTSTFKDRYRDRIIFTLEDLHGDVVGFSGRKYKDNEANEAKYINSPETVLFKKSQLLYNLKNSMESCKKDGYIYLLEGFMDVIALYRAGITSAVGLMGTSLSKEHVALFKKLNVEIRLCLDSDGPGQAATEKCIAALYEERVNFKVIKPLYNGKDPDELLDSEGKEALVAAMNEIEEPIIHSLNYNIKAKLLNTYEDKEKFLVANKNYFYNINTLALNEVLDTLSLALNVSVDSIKNVYRSLRNKSDIKSVQYGDNKPDRRYEYTYIDSSVDIYKALTDYILNITDNVRLKSINSKPIVINESRIIARMVMSRKMCNDFLKTESFVISQYNLLVRYFNDYYLRNSVECLCVEKLGDIEDSVENTYGELIETNQKLSKDKDEILGIILRLKVCHIPCKTNMSDSSISNLIDTHKDLCLKFDISNKSLDDKSKEELISKLQKNYSKKLEGKKNNG